MRKLNILWLDCDICENSDIEVLTEKGCSDYLYQGDRATCKSCGKSGTIDAEDDIAWVEWE